MNIAQSLQVHSRT